MLRQAVRLRCVAGNVSQRFLASTFGIRNVLIPADFVGSGANESPSPASTVAQTRPSGLPAVRGFRVDQHLPVHRDFAGSHAFFATERKVEDSAEPGVPPLSPEEVTPEPFGPSAQETPQEAAHAYWALAGMHASIAAPHFIFPEEVALVLFAQAALPIDPVQIEIIRMLGTGYLAASVSMLALKAGAERRELHKSVYRRLNMGAVTFATAALAAEVLHVDLLEITASIGMATVLGITSAVPSYYYAMTSGHSLGLWSIFKGVVKDLDILGRVRNGKGFAYALLTPAFYGAGLACMLTSEESLTNVFLFARGEDCITLWRMFGASMLMLPTWTVSLKEAADRMHLDRPPYITLNMGLVLTGLLNVAILSPWWTQYSAGPVMPLMLGTWAAAAAIGAWGELTTTSGDPITHP